MDEVKRISDELYAVAKSIEKCVKDRRYQCELPLSEGLIRTGISRAYYAVFLLARKAYGINTQEASVHKHIIDRLRSDNKKVANMMKTLRRLRNKADYEVDTINRDMLTYAISLAEDIRIFLEELMNK